MTQATHKRKHCIGDLLTVSEDEFMNIMMGSQEARRQPDCSHGAGAVAKCLHLCKLKAEKELIGHHEGL